MDSKEVRAIALLRENKISSVVAGEQSYLALSQYAGGSKRYHPPFRSGEVDCFSEQKSRLRCTLLARWDEGYEEVGLSVTNLGSDPFR